MKVTNRDIVSMEQGGKDLAGGLRTICSCKMPVAIAYKFNKLKLKVLEQLNLIEETRSGVIIAAAKMEDGKLVRDGDSYEIDPSKVDQYNKDMAELYDIEFEFDWTEVSLSEMKISDIENGALLKLDCLITLT